MYYSIHFTTFSVHIHQITTFDRDTIFDRLFITPADTTYNTTVSDYTIANSSILKIFQSKSKKLITTYIE